MSVILHLVAAEAWRGWPADTDYVEPSLHTEGFIHCTGDEATLLAVANALYRDDLGEMIALEIDETRLSADVRWEPAMPAPPPGVDAGVLFPHVYGPIAPGAVTSVRRFLRDADGTYIGYEPL